MCSAATKICCSQISVTFFLFRDVNVRAWNWQQWIGYAVNRREAARNSMLQQRSCDCFIYNIVRSFVFCCSHSASLCLQDPLDYFSDGWLGMSPTYFLQNQCVCTSLCDFHRYWATSKFLFYNHVVTIICEVQYSLFMNVLCICFIRANSVFVLSQIY